MVLFGDSANTQEVHLPPPPRYLSSLNDSPPPRGKGRSLPFSGSVSHESHHFGTKQLCCHGNTPLHFFCQVCLVSWPLCLSLSISHRNSLGFQEHKIETKLSTNGVRSRDLWRRVKFDGISAHYISTCSTKGLEFNTI